MRYVVVGGIAVQVVRNDHATASGAFLCVAVVCIGRIGVDIVNLPLGGFMLPYGPLDGVNSAAVHGLYMHNLGRALDSAGRTGHLYYFLPLSAKNNALQS